MDDWKGEISRAFSREIANSRGYEGGSSDPTDIIISKDNLMANIKTESSEITEDEHYVDYLKDKKDLLHIYKLIRNKKLSNNKIKQEIKKYLKSPEDVKKFLEAILNTKKTKKEYKEATGASSAGGYEQPLFTKMETKEATGSSSSGSYETPAAWAKSLSKKHWRGKSKTQIPGGKFVQVKKKCKRFPYCNQGDIKALNIFENETLKNTIKKISEKYEIHEEIIKDIIMTEMNKSIH